MLLIQLDLAIMKGQLISHAESLVITRCFSFSGRCGNRWKFDLFNELIHYRFVQNWKATIPKSIFPNLRRVKICLLPAPVQIEELLINLCNNSFFLEYLEIDRFKLDFKNRIYTLPSLKKLSINSIDSAFDNRVQFNAPQLRAVYLGKFCSLFCSAF